MSKLEILDISKEYSFNLSNAEEKRIIVFNNENSVNNFKLNVSLQNSSILYIYNVVTTLVDASLNECINIEGKDALVKIINVLLVKTATLESNIVINHNVGESESNFANYCIALKDSNVILNNNAFIKNGCHKSTVHQKAKGLALDNTARITAQPNLFIDEFDVIASHAASIGSINKEDLFYLTSRGLTVDEASKLIVLGFIRPVIDEIEDESLKETLYTSFTKLL